MDSLFAPVAARPEKSAGSDKALWGLANRRLRWSLSWKGWIVVLLAAIGVGILGVRGIHPFLAVTDRVQTDTMVVEGWMDQTDLAEVAELFKQGHYQRVFTTGGPVHGMMKVMSEYSTSAHIAAEQLTALGVPAGVMQSVPSYVQERDRTYGSAVALRNWFRDHRVTVPSFEVITLNAHARRSRLLFEEAFGPETKIGVVALENTDYDDVHWWRYSEGVREIVSEGTSYLYARFLFRPDRGAQSSTAPAQPSTNN